VAGLTGSAIVPVEPLPRGEVAAVPPVPQPDEQIKATASAMQTEMPRL